MSEFFVRLGLNYVCVNLLCEGGLCKYDLAQQVRDWWQRTVMQAWWFMIGKEQRRVLRRVARRQNPVQHRDLSCCNVPVPVRAERRPLLILENNRQSYRFLLTVLTSGPSSRLFSLFYFSFYFSFQLFTPTKQFYGKEQWNIVIQQTQRPSTTTANMFKRA